MVPYSFNLLLVGSWNTIVPITITCSIIENTKVFKTITLDFKDRRRLSRMHILFHQKHFLACMCDIPNTPFLSS